jgi:hypothetical protein
MLAKILGPETAQALAGDSEDGAGEFRPGMPAPMLDIIMRSGRVESFGYAYLTRVSFDPRGRLLLYFGDDVVVLEGRNLQEMRQKIRMHREYEVREGTEAEDALKPEAAEHVERVYFTSREELEKGEQAHDTRDRKGAVRR